jgi:hypothetical protein
MTPAEQVLLAQRNAFLDQLTNTLVRVIELENELAAMQKEKSDADGKD